MGHSLLGEDAPPAALGAEGVEIRVRGVHGDAQLQGHVPLQVGRVERDQMRQLCVGDQRTDARQHVRPVQQLAAQRRGRAVLHADEVQPLARVRVDDAGQQAQIVVDDGGLHRQRRDIDEAQVGLAQEEEQKEEALLVGLQRGRGHIYVEGERRHDDGRVLVLHRPARSRADLPPEGDELTLQPVEVGCGRMMGSAHVWFLRTYKGADCYPEYQHVVGRKCGKQLAADCHTGAGECPRRICVLRRSGTQHDRLRT